MIEKRIVKFLEFSSAKYSFLDKIPQGGRVLDIGCGDCRRLRYRTYFRADLIHYGVDIKEYASCRPYLQEFYCVDISTQKLPFQPESFDLVVMSHVTEHISGEHTPHVMAEAGRVLKENG